MCGVRFSSWILVLGLILGVAQAQAAPQAVVRLGNASPMVGLDGARLDAWLETATQRWSPEQIRSSQNPQLQGSSFGYRREPVWLRFPVQNDSSFTQWHLLFHPRTLQVIELSVFDAQGHLVQEGRYRIGHAGEGGSLHRITPTFELNLPKGQLLTLVAKVQGFEPLDLDISLGQPEVSDRLSGYLDLGLGIYVGILAALMIYTYFIFRALRERFFPPYIGVMGTMLVLVPTLNGAYDFLIPMPWLFSDFIALSAALACLAANDFCRHFLNLRKEYPRLERFQAGLSVVAVAASIQALPPIYRRFPLLVGTTNDLLILLTVALIIVSGVLGVRRGIAQAKYFLAAWLGFLFSTVFFQGVTYGYFPNNSFTRSLVEIFNTLEMVILAFAISERVRMVEKDRVLALKKSWRAEHLENLIKMVCHDIANPLHAVVSHAEQARRGKPVNWDAVLKAVEEQQQILSFARNQGRSVEVADRPVLGDVKLQDVLDTLYFLFDRVAHEKRVELVLPRAGESGGLSVRAELTSLVHSVLGNALSNAIKFSSPGGQVRVLLFQNPDAVEISVEDDGTGIPEEVQRALRADGKAVSRPGVRGESGSGFGFQLMHYFVRSFGGELTWSSHHAGQGPGKTGTRVGFRLKRV